MEFMTLEQRIRKSVPNESGDGGEQPAARSLSPRESASVVEGLVPSDLLESIRNSHAELSGNPQRPVCPPFKVVQHETEAWRVIVSFLEMETRTIKELIVPDIE